MYIEAARELWRERRTGARRRIVLNNSMADDARPGVHFERLHYLGNFVLFPPIVAVEKGNDLTVRLWNREVKSGCLATVALAHVADARRKFADDLGRVIRGTVVNDKNFQIARGKILLEHTHDRFFDETFVVIRVN
jgi:hypothetical protein